jgi:hypothetical protein
VITPIELAEAQYNARDTLGMCRVYPHLVAEVERTNTVDVYNTDETLADLALQMTRIGMPVNSQLRAEIGQRLYALRDSAVEILRPYTEGEYLDSFLDWVAIFFAAKARKGEPVEGAIRIGPARAQAAVDEIQAAQKAWREFKKNPPAPPPADDLTAGAEYDQAIASADEQLAALADLMKAAKADLKAARFEDDANDGLIHSVESAFDQRVKIRKADAALAVAKAGVKFTAKVQQAAILRTAGVPLTEVTDKSKLPKIDKDILERFSRHPSAKALLRFVRVSSTINVYIEGDKRAAKGGGKNKPVMVTESGYLNPSWIVHKITGRWGSSPNVQNWSKRAGGGAENLRSMIEAPEGYTFVGWDFAQLEARLIGAMSQCKYLIETFQRQEDIHGAFAAIGFPNDWPRLSATFKEHKKAVAKGEKCPCPTCAERDKVRDLTKRMEYGCIYGGVAKGIWEAMVGDFPTLTQRQVQFFLDSFARSCPEVITWRNETLREAINNGEICSPILGRREVFPLGRVDPTVAFNFKAQAGGADLWAVGALAFMELYDQFNSVDVRICHNGHDSSLILCREELAPQVQIDAQTCWNREWGGVPFFIEVKIANRWSET